MKTQKIQVINLDNNSAKVGDTVEVKKILIAKPKNNKNEKAEQPTLREVVTQGFDGINKRLDKLEYRFDNLVEVNNLKE